MQGKTTDIPSSAVILALTSRFHDLQDSRHDVQAVQIWAPEPDINAHKRFAISEAILQHLSERLRGGVDTGIPTKQFFEEVVAEIPDVTIEDVRFCIRFLDTPREIRYGVVDASGGLQERSAKATSRLLKYNSSQDTAKLTRYGKSYLRMLKSSDTWLFEDRQVAKIGDALNGNLFEHVIPICEEAVVVLREMVLSIVQAHEAPSQNDIIQHFLDYRSHYSDMIERCLNEVRRGHELLRTQAIQENFSAWSERYDAPDGLTRGDLRAAVDGVHRVVERLCRKWTDFLNDVMNLDRKRFGVVDFRAAAMYVAKTTYDAPLMTNFILAAGPPIMDSTAFSCDTFMGVLAPVEDVNSEAELFGWEEADEDDEVSELKAWIEKYRDVLVLELRKGPRNLRDLISGDFVSDSVVSGVSDVFSLVSLKSVVEDGPICIGISDGEIDLSMEDGRVSAVNLMVWLDPTYVEGNHVS